MPIADDVSNQAADEDIDDGLRVLQQWGRVGHPIRKLMTAITREADIDVLDPSWCVKTCPYGFDTLTTQRYTLLKRLYQVQFQLDNLMKL